MGADLARRAFRKSGQHDDIFAAHVQPLIIVEAGARRIEAVADEDGRRGQLLRRRERAGADRHLACGIEALLADPDPGGGRRPRFDKGHGLVPAAVRAGRRQAERQEARRHIARRQIEAAAARIAPFHEIAGEELDMAAEARRLEARFLGGGGRGRGGDGGQEECKLRSGHGGSLQALDGLPLS